MYYYGKGVDIDYKKAIEWYRKSALQGNRTGQNNLGTMYENGKGVDIDYKKAIEWYSKSSLQGNRIAQNNLDKLLSEKKYTNREYFEVVDELFRLKFKDFLRKYLINDLINLVASYL